MTNSTTGLPEYDYGDGKINGLVRPMYGSANPLNDIQLGTDSYNGNSFNVTGTAEIRSSKTSHSHRATPECSTSSAPTAFHRTSSDRLPTMEEV